MEQKQAIILFHTVCANYGITDDQKQAIYSSYGVDSSKKMAASELQQAANSISQESQLWRTRVMGAIGGYLKRTNQTGNSALIKAIACRAAKTDDFNKIKIAELRRIYNLFLKKQDNNNNHDNHDNNDNNDNN